MGKPDYVRLAQLGQLPPEVSRDYDLMKAENEALRKKVEAQQGEINNLISKLSVKKYAKNKTSDSTERGDGDNGVISN